MHRLTALAAIAAAFAIANLLVIASPPASRAADVLDYVPPDALGFVVARDIGALDKNAQQLFTMLQLPFGGPLAFLQAATGIDEGLDKQGSLLLVALPDDAGRQPKLCVWLPVADYDRFLESLGSKPAAGRITAITVAEVDLLAARDGEWMLVMDPDERERMEQMIAGQRSPPQQVAAWKSWLQTNDAAAVVFSGGLHDLLNMAAGPRPYGVSAGDAIEDDEAVPFDEDDVFGPPATPTRPVDDIGIQLQNGIRTVMTSSPKALQWAHALNAIAIGVRLDEQSNLQAGVRAIWNKDGNFAPGSAGDDGRLPPSLLTEGDFVLHGAGHLPQPLSAVVAGAYVRLLVEDLKSEMGLWLDGDTVARFQDAVEQAAAAVPSAAVLTLAGAKGDGVYTNQFLVARVESAKEFVEQANEMMRLWNQMNRDAEHGTRLVFDVEEQTIAGRTTTHYTLDVAALDGGPVIPEVRQVMEKFFGLGGKLRLIVAVADDRHALLALATPEQAEGAIKTLRENPASWDAGQIVRIPSGLLPRKGDWQLYFSPYGYIRWLTRQTDAMTGPVIGGPIVKPYPPSPPIGVTGGAKDYELWVDAVAPSGTIRGAGEFLKAQHRQIRRQ